MFYISKKIKKALIITAIIIAVLVLGVLICISLAFDDENTDKYNSVPSSELAQTVAVNAAFGNECRIDEKGLNECIAYLIQNANENGRFQKDFRLTAAYIDINAGKPSRAYFQINKDGKLLGFSADIISTFDVDSGLVKLSFENAAVGKLKIPKSMITKALSKTNLGNISDYISIDELTVTVPTHYEIKVENIGTIVNIDIINLEVHEDELYIQTNPIAQDVVDNIKGLIGDSIGSLAENFKKKYGDLF